MIIRTPADLIGYLKGVAARHPLVKHVITGEHSRVEDATGADARYPEVHIETPTFYIPISQGQNSMTSRVFVYSNTPEEDNGSEDFNASQTLQIASEIIAAIKYHASDDIISLALGDRGFQLDPIISVGSDQLRGYQFSVTVEIDQMLCKDNNLNPDKIFVPAFSWVNLNPANTVHLIGGAFKITDESILGNGAFDTQKFWIKEEVQYPNPTLWNINSPISIDPLSDYEPYYRIVHVWCQIVGIEGELKLWAYARIDGRFQSGRSVPFVPKGYYPI